LMPYRELTTQAVHRPPNRGRSNLRPSGPSDRCLQGRGHTSPLRLRHQLEPHRLDRSVGLGHGEVRRRGPAHRLRGDDLHLHGQRRVGDQDRRRPDGDLRLPMTLSTSTPRQPSWWLGDGAVFVGLAGHARGFGCGAGGGVLRVAGQPAGWLVEASRSRRPG